MGKGGAVLGFIGILLGAGGLIFAFMVWNNQTTTQASAPTDIWFQYDRDSFDGVALTYLDIPNMTISFNLENPASIHILFTCTAIIQPNSGVSIIRINFRVDGVFQSYPTFRAGSNQGGSLVDFIPVTLQHVIEDFPAGTHNVTVVLYSNDSDNSVEECGLTIQAYPV